MEFQAITVTVPKHLVSDLYAFVAELTKRGEQDGTAEDDQQRARRGFSEDDVRRAYHGGDSEHWRPFLQVLANNAGEWVVWETLCSRIGLTPRQASGMLGAAERRCKQHPPYDKSYENGQYWFRMPTEVAELVHRYAAISRRLKKGHATNT